MKAIRRQWTGGLSIAPDPPHATGAQLLSFHYEVGRLALSGGGCGSDADGTPGAGAIGTATEFG